MSKDVLLSKDVLVDVVGTNVRWISARDFAPLERTLVSSKVSFYKCDGNEAATSSCRLQREPNSQPPR